MVKVVNKKATNAKGWSATAKKLNRDKMKPSQFLVPSQKKFPFYNNKGQIDGKALFAAFIRAKSLGNRSVAKKAVSKAKRLGIEWAKKYNLNGTKKVN